MIMEIPAGEIRLGDRVRVGEHAPLIVVRVTRPSRRLVVLWNPDRTIEVQSDIPLWIERREPRVVHVPARPFWERAA